MNTQIQELEQLKPMDMDAGLVFSGKPSGKMVAGFAKPCAYTPKIDSDYVFHESSRDLVVWLLDPQDPLYLFGPTGCGKTSAIKQLAARLNYPVFEVNGHGRLEFADLVGHLAVRNGNMQFEYGPLALAMRYGALLLLNEIDLTPPEVAAGLNTVLDGSPLCIAENGGELVVPHPMFRFVATANTSGIGDDTGLYQGTQQQNLAWLDRFMVVELSYPDSETEEKLLADHYPAIPADTRKHMVSLANEVRKQFMGSGDVASNNLEVTLSTRTLLRWAALTIRFQPLATQGISPIRYALDRALTFRACRESRAALHELAERHFPSHAQVHAGNVQKTASSNSADELQSASALAYLTSALARTTLSAKPTVHLRNDSSATHGGTKDWIGTASTNALDIRFGKTGSVNQTRSFSCAKCQDGNPLKELQARASTKINEGYRLLPNLCHF